MSVMTDKEFVDNLKLYLSSVSDRGAAYAYVNIKDGELVLCNSSSKKSLYGDRLMNFADGTLSVHLVKFKNKEIWERLKSILRFDELKGITVLYLTRLFKHLSTDDLNKVKFLTDDKAIRVQGDNTEDGIVGEKEDNFHILREVIRWYNAISLFHKDNLCAYVCGDFDLGKPSGKLYYMDVCLDKFTDKNGNRLFGKMYDRVKLLMVNGLSTVSYAFLTKCKKSEKVEHKYLLWTDSGTGIRMMSLFSDSTAKIVTYRPNSVIIPIPLTVPIDPNVI